MEQKPRIVITMGDPAGIGPEIIAKSAGASDLLALCRPVVIGDAGVLRKAVADLRLPVSVRTIHPPDDAEPQEGTIVVDDLNMIDPARHSWGRPDTACGHAVVAYIRKAVDLCMSGKADAMVTAPISKEIINAAGYRYAGHTELLADLTGSTDYGMLFVGGGLRVILATIHVALKDVPHRLTEQSLLKTLRLAHAAMRSFGIEKPRIGIAALNPHAGEGGLFGSEEQNVMLPAIRTARAEGIDASDPLPADTLFHKARNGGYDIVAAMYHDQGLAPLKMLAFGNAVNVTVGLPIIRTSVDHGTAYDIAGKGCADPASLREAVLLAVRMSQYRTGRSR